VVDSDSVMVEIIDKVLSSLPEKESFYSELEKMDLTLKDIPNNLYYFHEALKRTFGTHHYSIESLIIKTLHENTKQGIYNEKEASVVAIRLIDVFTKEHNKEISAVKKALDQNSNLNL
jgi:hypothetical protein